MAQAFTGVQPRPEFNWVDNTGRPTQQFAQYMALLDALIRLLGASNLGPVTALATPSNANAAAAGVPIGGLYTSTANPAPIYIRTA